MRFTKMHGLGNDYVYVDCFRETVLDPERLARSISDRHRGVGSDGLILIVPDDDADVRMKMYNADGSRAEMCGNGIRCVAKYAFEHHLSRSNPMRVQTDSGVRDVELQLESNVVSAARVNMGRPSLMPSDLPAEVKEPIVDHELDIDGQACRMTCVSMGNPHAVIFVEALDSIELARLGAVVGNHPMFPERINAHFVAVDDPSNARMITWERGSGATQACGTGACAVVVAGVLTERLSRQARVQLPGGGLEIEWADNDHVFMTGPAVEVYSGNWPDSD
jgi:diaminopimelate epimerase